MTEDQRLFLVSLDLAQLPGVEPGETLTTTLGVNAILRVAVDNDFALRRLRRRPVTLAEEFYKMVEA